MNTIDHVLDLKGRDVFATSPSKTIEDAVIEMCRLKVGVLIVADPAGAPVGIISERDMMTRVLLARRDPAKTTVGDIMTRRVVCIEADRTIPGALALMTYAHCRHLPVVKRGKMVGVVSMRDLARAVSADQEYELRLLRDCVAQKYPA